MSKKKVSYMGLLKEAISEFDTSKSVDVKGPMLDPILSYSGGGELPTHKDAASILERYYFKEDEDTGVNVIGEDTLAADTNDVDAIPGKDPKKTRADVEKELKEEDEPKVDDDEPIEESAEPDKEDDDDDKEEEAAEVEESASVELENSVIEKLIAEMEDEGAEEVEEANRVAGDRGTQGEEAMGTNNYDDQVPGRKDVTKEADEADEADADEADEDEDKEKDIDKKVEEMDAGANAGQGGGPIGKAKKGGEDEVEEAFKIFEKEIADLDDDDIKV